MFDVAKLDWLNGKYLRELQPEAFVERVLAWGGDRARFAQMAELAQARIERLSDLGPLLAFFFAGRLPLTEAQLLDGQKLDRDDVRRALALAMWDLDAARAVRQGDGRGACSRASANGLSASCATWRGCSTSR